MTKRDLGSSHQGTKHFWHQRITGLANLALGLACMIALSFYGRTMHSEVLNWFSQPWVIGAMTFLILSVLWHMKLGLSVVIDDYVHKESLRLLCQVSNIFITLLAGVFALLALMQILLGEPSLSSAPIEPMYNEDNINDGSIMNEQNK